VKKIFLGKFICAPKRCNQNFVTAKDKNILMKKNSFKKKVIHTFM